MSGDQFDIVQGNRETITGTLHDPAATTGDVLTVQADKSIAAQPGGGGSGGVQVVTVPVSSAQILDLFNTPVVLIPGVPNTVAVVTGVGAVVVAGATPYADPGNTLSISQVDPVSFASASWNAAGFLDQATDTLFVQPYGNLTGVVPTAGPVGQDVLLFAGTGNPTLGDGTLLVTVSYFLAPTAQRA